MAAGASAALTPRVEGLLWGALGVLAFSVSLPMTRLAVAGGLPPSFVGIGRAVVAGVLALGVLIGMRQTFPAPRVLVRLAVVAVGVVFGFPLFTALALARVPSAHGVVVVALLPAATAVAAVLRAGERPGWRFWAAAGAGLVCVLSFVALHGSGGAAFAVGWADLYLLIAVVLCALGYAEGGALARELGGIRVICLALVGALPVTTVWVLATLDIGALSHATQAAWGGFAYVSGVSMFAGFFAWYRGLALGGVARVGQVQLAQPVLSLGWSALLLGETVTSGMLVAAVAVLACIFATQRAR